MALALERSADVTDDLEIAKIEFHRAWLSAERKRFDEAIRYFDDVVMLRRARRADMRDIKYAEIGRLIAMTHGGDPTRILKEAGKLAVSGDPLPRLLIDYYLANEARKIADRQRSDGTFDPIAVETARKRLHAVLAAVRDHLPPRHPLVALLLGDVASFEWNHQNNRLAWDLIREAVEIGAEVAPAHPQLLSAMDRIAKEAPDAGLENEADTLFHHVLAATETIDSPEIRENARKRLIASLSLMPKYRSHPNLLQSLQD
jgi:hypothetical protein